MNTTERWIEPGTARAYPFAYDAYRRLRESQDRRLPRHQLLGAQVDRHVWRRWRVRATASVDVLLTVRGASPRLRRMVAAILASIRRGHPADEAIRIVSRRFGLPQSRTRAHLAGCVGFELRRHETPPWASGDPALACPLTDWA